jgi:hypothetical protein
MPHEGTASVIHDVFTYFVLAKNRVLPTRFLIIGRTEVITLLLTLIFLGLLHRVVVGDAASIFRVYVCILSVTMYVHRSVLKRNRINGVIWKFIIY